MAPKVGGGGSSIYNIRDQGCRRLGAVNIATRKPIDAPDECARGFADLRVLARNSSCRMTIPRKEAKIRQDANQPACKAPV